MIVIKIIGRIIAVSLVCIASLLVQVVVVPIPVDANSAAVTTGWEVKEFKQLDERVIYARVPSCAPAAEQACVDYLAKQRPLIIYAHGAGAAEDLSQATKAVNNLAAISPNAIYAYAVSKDGTKRWDTGICCTYKAVEDVEYLVQAVDQIAATYGVKRSGVGMIGDSNGGMLSHKAACERPDVFKAGTSFGGTYTGPCDKKNVILAQWHGGADNVVPVNGGDLKIDGRVLTFPPASAIATRMSAGSQFVLTIEPGLGHFPHWWIYWQELYWLAGHIGR